jgi:hypothetical protein
MHDIPKYARMKNKMEFVAHEMVGILQNVSQNRENKKITLTDIKHAMCAAYLSIYPGVTMYATSQYHMPLGHFVHGWIYYVTGLAEGNASVVWSAAFLIDNKDPACGIQNSQHGESIVKYKQNANPSEIYKDLRINEGEVKILVECSSMYPSKSGDRYFSDGRGCSNVSPREAFGFWALTPKSQSPNGWGYFNTVVIFTPKPGLFSETGSQ